MADTNEKKKKKKVHRKGAPKNFSLYKAWEKDKAGKSNAAARDKAARTTIEENYGVKGKTSVLPGQLILFDYLQPIHKEELEYYDAMPCTIFFGVRKDKAGQTRVLGFNIHYYPPKFRVKMMTRILEIFKDIYKPYWDETLKKAIDKFDYQLLMYLLQKDNIAFGVRMYDPKLMGNIIPVPVSGWVKAVQTEGHFKKETRSQILQYWKQWSPSSSTRKAALRGKGKAKRLDI